MTGDQTAYLIFLGVLLVGLVFFSLPRRALGGMLRAAGAWVLIFVGVTVGYGLWQDIQTELPDQSYAGSVVTTSRDFDGHYRLVLDIDGAPVRFIVDTGATDVVLSREDAARVGIDVDALVPTGVAQTANGLVQTSRVRLDEVRLGEIVDRGVRASVNKGEMPASLLGMSYLERFERVSIEGGELVLER